MKKVLIITYYWPPGGGAGIYRVLKFAKYLPQFNWQPIILTVKQGTYPVIDHGLEKDVPSNCPVYRCKSIEPFGIYKKFTGRNSDEAIPDYVFYAKNSLKDHISRWIRFNCFIPDSRMGWTPSAVKIGLKIIKTEHIDLIFSSSPPNTVQVIANQLARKSGIKWVADFRDPWTDALTYQGIRRSFLTTYIDHRLERNVLQRADAITCVNQDYIDIFKKRVSNNEFTLKTP
jgi:glycosyltransferase involved in cell wall biosynthesis